MRTVLDTNVLVSALLSDGVCRQLLGQASSGRLRLLLSPETTQELLAVLARPKFGLAAGQPKLILAQDLLPFADVIQTKPETLSHPCRDPKDDKFLHCALQGKAQLLITGDKDLGALKKHYSFEILEPRAAWTKIMGQRS